MILHLKDLSEYEDERILHIPEEMALLVLRHEIQHSNFAGVKNREISRKNFCILCHDLEGRLGNFRGNKHTCEEKIAFTKLSLISQFSVEFDKSKAFPLIYSAKFISCSIF